MNPVYRPQTSWSSQNLSDLESKLRGAIGERALWGSVSVRQLRDRQDRSCLDLFHGETRSHVA
jgi:hypothetical protein